MEGWLREAAGMLLAIGHNAPEFGSLHHSCLILSDSLRQIADRLSVAGDDVAPIPMMLFCPKCGLQHIDMPDPTDDWDNPPHKSHKCVGPNGCGTVWRPADVPTEGVAAIQTRGSKDTVFYNHAALTALQVTEGDKVERLIEARKVVAKEYRRLGLNPNPVLRGDFDAGVEVQAALRSQSNKVSKP